MEGHSLIICISCLLLASLTPQITALTDDLYNTEEISSDLSWTHKPGDNAWSEQSGGDGKGGTIRTLEICNALGSTDEEHWLRSPFIDAKNARRVNLEISYSIYKCPNCRETFTLYYYQAESDLSTSTFPPWNDNLYEKIDTVAADKRYDGSQQQGSVNVKTLDIGPLKRKGFYLAIRDQGACMSIIKVRLYYHYCPQATRNLARFARTVVGAGEAELVTVEGECIGNAVFDKDDAPMYYCNTNGEWTVPTGKCMCDRGYQQTADGRCLACPPRTYKWTKGNGTCEKCPAHSSATSSGSSLCRCLPNYYRVGDDDITAQCKRIPSEPVDLDYKMTKNGVQIEWKPPRNSGDDVYYSLTCYVCDESYMECSRCPDTVQFFPKNYDKIEATDMLLSDLDQFSFYKIKIHSYNGVSKKSGKPASYNQILFSTSETVPSAVVDVVAGEPSPDSLALYWSEPERHSAVIIDYEIQLRALGSGARHMKEPYPLTVQTANRNTTVSGLKQGTSYEVTIRARTTAGYGQFSDGQIFTTAQEAPAEGNSGVLIAVVVCAVVIVALAVVCIVKYRRSSKRSKENERVSAKLNGGSSSTPNNAARLIGNSSNGGGGGKSTNQAMNQPLSGRTATRKTYVDYRDPHKGVKEIANEIELSKIKIHSVIGQGEFGEVCRGQIVERKKKPLDVAVKRLKDGASIVDQTNFLREACTMAQFHDPNIVELKGVVTKHMPAMIVTEYMENGSLDKYLQKRKGELSVIDLLKMQRGIASGMKYLANMKYVHRDLAARNILIDSKHCCKVSDFGLSRTLENDPNATYTTQGGKIALRWTAPECIRYRKFTSASDVWSYGIVMWEVMSYGEKPYWDMNNDDVTDVIEDGYRLPCPGDCPCILHEMMLKCWSYDPRKRPDFAEIYTQLSSYVSKPNLLKTTVENSCAPSSSDPSTCDSTQPLLNPDSPTSIQDVSTLEEWLDMVRLGKYRRSFYAHGINDLEALSNISTSDLERLGIATPEHRTRLQSGIDTLRRHFNHSQRFSLPPDESVSIAISDPISIQHHQKQQQPVPTSVSGANGVHHPASAVPMMRQQQQQPRPESFRTHRCDPSIAIV